MSRRPPSARDPQRALIGRTMPAVNRLLPGHLQARAATPLPRPLPNRQSYPPGGQGWGPEAVIKYGSAIVATNVLPPGLRVPAAATLRSVYVRVGTAPTGASLTVLMKRSGSTLATIAVTAGSTSASSTGLATPLAAGDVITFDISTVGSTVPGADVIVQIVTS